MKGKSTDIGNRQAMKAMLQMVDSTSNGATSVDEKRKLLARLCKLVGKQIGAMPSSPSVKLSPRLQQTLDCLKTGASEKEAALKLGISKHTLHVYVKMLHRRLGVSSRAELMARVLQSDSAS